MFFQYVPTKLKFCVTGEGQSPCWCRTFVLLTHLLARATAWHGTSDVTEQKAVLFCCAARSVAMCCAVRRLVLVSCVILLGMLVFPCEGLEFTTLDLGVLASTTKVDRIAFDGTTLAIIHGKSNSRKMTVATVQGTGITSSFDVSLTTATATVSSFEIFEDGTGLDMLTGSPGNKCTLSGSALSCSQQNANYETVWPGAPLPHGYVWTVVNTGTSAYIESFDVQGNVLGKFDNRGTTHGMVGICCSSTAECLTWSVSGCGQPLNGFLYSSSGSFGGCVRITRSIC